MLSTVFARFARSEQSGSILLISCAVISLVLANSPFGPAWVSFWHRSFAGLTLELWVNDALMAVFFLLIGLELEREILAGELSDPRKAALPIVAAIGGMVMPAAIHYAFNNGLPTVRGFGVPMATDIAFALGALALLRGRIPTTLRMFIVAFAVIDDLGAILIIAIFYTAKVSFVYLAAAVALWCALFVLRRWFRVRSLTPYLIGGIALWVLMLQSGVHATLAGVALAFAIPFRGSGGELSPSERLEHSLSRPVAYFILPVFALANAGVILDATALQTVFHSNGAGIIAGLMLGKPIGIVLFSAVAVIAGFSRLPSQVTWAHMLGAGLLGGIGFTMSIFIANLAFTGSGSEINVSKLAILIGSTASAVMGYLWLRFFAPARIAA
jgi:NhaA family Na+:H+ antiporter